jgi:hypothetical protein
LIVIATEDTYAPEQYFGIFKGNGRQVKVLRTDDCRSSPEAVHQRLKDFRRQHELLDDDELWLMLDTDHWTQPNHVANYVAVCTEAIQNGFQLANNNPCFEVWLLLHHDDLNASEQLSCASQVEDRLRQVLGAYNKRKLDLTKFTLDGAKIAADRAERLDAASDDRWPQTTGSHVYRIVKRLFPDVPA